jgi:hypothetical protein
MTALEAAMLNVPSENASLEERTVWGQHIVKWFVRAASATDFLRILTFPSQETRSKKFPNIPNSRFDELLQSFDSYARTLGDVSWNAWIGPWAPKFSENVRTGMGPPNLSPEDFLSSDTESIGAPPIARPKGRSGSAVDAKEKGRAAAADDEVDDDEDDEVEGDEDDEVEGDEDVEVEGDEGSEGELAGDGRVRASLKRDQSDAGMQSPEEVSKKRSRENPALNHFEDKNEVRVRLPRIGFFLFLISLRPFVAFQTLRIVCADRGLRMFRSLDRRPLR